MASLGLPGITTNPKDILEKAAKDPKLALALGINPMAVTHKESIEALKAEPAEVQQAQVLPTELEQARQQAAQETREKEKKRRTLIMTSGQGVTTEAATRKPSLLAAG